MEMREGCAGKYKLRDHVVAEQKLWRTPSVAEEKNQNTSTQIYLQNQVGATPKAWATPSGFMNTNPAELERNSLNLGMQAVQNGATGKLNPRWVSVLMNLPVFWVKT
jgi:hypothetical protein